VTRYITLAEYLWLAEQLTDLEAVVLSKASRIDLADSALHAPEAGFGDQDFYQDLIDKAAVLAKGPVCGCALTIQRGDERRQGPVRVPASPSCEGLGLVPLPVGQGVPADVGAQLPPPRPPLSRMPSHAFGVAGE